MNTPCNIAEHFVVLSPDKVASTEKATPTLYLELERKYRGFTGHELISSYEFSEDWQSWEMHPRGDEIILLLEGDVTFVLDDEEGQRSLALNEPGSFLIVPRGTWHTARTNTKTRMLFITPGEDTQHAPNPGGYDRDL